MEPLASVRGCRAAPALTALSQGPGTSFGAGPAMTTHLTGAQSSPLPIATAPTQAPHVCSPDSYSSRWAGHQHRPDPGSRFIPWLLFRAVTFCELERGPRDSTTEGHSQERAKQVPPGSSGWHPCPLLHSATKGEEGRRGLLQRTADVLGCKTKNVCFFRLFDVKGCS